MTFEDLKPLATAWLEPIPGSAPSGVSCKLDSRYEAVVSEVAKLDSPTGGAVDWDKVVAQSGELLKTASKDLLLGSYLAYGLYATRGLPGLTTGTVLLAEMLAAHWPGLFPELKRLRGRVNALTWFIEKAALAAGEARASGDKRTEIERLTLAVKRLAEVSREKFEAQAPSLRPLQENVERLRLSLPPVPAPSVPSPTPPAPSPAPPAPERAASAMAPAQALPAAAPQVPTPVTPPAPQPAPNETAPAKPEVAAAAPAQSVPAARVAPAVPAAQPAVLAIASPETALVAGADATDYLRKVGTSLVDAAGQLRSASPKDSTAYRILRTGLWLHLTQPPPSDAERRTQVPALAASLRTRLELMLGNARWLELLEESESALVRARFNLDLQRYSALALRSMGDGFRGAREAVLIEVRALLERMPSLAQLRASDGSPFADKATEAWLEEEVLGSGGGPGAAPLQPSQAAAVGDLAELVGEAKALAAGNRLSEAFALLQSRIASTTSGGERFRARLQLARLAASSGQSGLARQLYEVLEQESRMHDLDTWEPTLAAECLAGALSVGGASLDEREKEERTMRLARLDPVAAMKAAR